MLPKNNSLIVFIVSNYIVFSQLTKGFKQHLGIIGEVQNINTTPYEN